MKTPEQLDREARELREQAQIAEDNAAAQRIYKESNDPNSVELEVWYGGNPKRDWLVMQNNITWDGKSGHYRPNPNWKPKPKVRRDLTPEDWKDYPVIWIKDESWWMADGIDKDGFMFGARELTWEQAKLDKYLLWSPTRSDAKPCYVEEGE